LRQARQGCITAEIVEFLQVAPPATASAAAPATARCLVWDPNKPDATPIELGAHVGDVGETMAVLLDGNITASISGGFDGCLAAD
jgi:hypothetical protein